MVKWINWFQNHSLRFKLVILVFAVVFVLQIINGFIFTSIVSERFEENISQSNLATVRQMSINLNLALEDIVNEMIPIREEILSRQFADLGEEGKNDYISRNIVYKEMFQNLIAANDNYRFVHSMLILNEENRSYYYVMDEYMRLKDELLFQKVLVDNAIKNQCYWGTLLPDSYYFTYDKEKIVSIILPICRYGEIKDLLIINLKENAIAQYLEDLGGGEEILLLQLSKDAIIWGKSRDSFAARELGEEEIINVMDWEEVENVGTNVMTSSSLGINGWTLSMITPKSRINSNAKVLSQFIVTIIVSTGIVLLVCVFYIVYIITKPIQKMTVIMEANRHTKQLNHRFIPKYRDEVGILAATYNQLMDEIQQLMADIEREQIQNRKTYLKMLQMQIKPHFLYNTLEAAKFLVEMGDPKGGEMLTTIGKFYKFSLSGIYDKVSLREELEHLDCYLKILKMRYSSKYDYMIEVSDEILENEVIKFSLQPLVENAVYHGIKQQRKKGFIKILGYQDGADAVIVVWDDGAGVPADKLLELQDKLSQNGNIQVTEHIGIINVHQRICIQYGWQYGLKISSQEGEFTRVEVRFPIRRIHDVEEQMKIEKG